MSVTRRTFFRTTGMGALAARILGTSSSVDASAHEGTGIGLALATSPRPLR